MHADLCVIPACKGTYLASFDWSWLSLVLKDRARSLLSKVLFGIHQSLAALLGFRWWANHHGRSWRFSHGVLFCDVLSDWLKLLK